MPTYNCYFTRLYSAEAEVEAASPEELEVKVVQMLDRGELSLEFEPVKKSVTFDNYDEC